MGKHFDGHDFPKNGTRVFLREGDSIEKALRKLKNKVNDAKIFDALREKEHYTKPSEKRKRAKSSAIARWKKYLKSQELPPKKY